MKNPGDLNKWEKEVYGSLLKNEEEVLEELKKMYESALNDIMEQVKSFDADISSLDELLQLAPDAAAGKILNLQQSKIYQKQYQEALQGQIQGILDRLNSEEYTSIDEYLKGCYEEGWTGSAYVLAQQGIPIITPIDQAAMTRAVLLDSKISNGLYEHLGVDVANLKKRITQEISRGIATGMSYRDIARNLNNTSKTGLSNAMRIVRTEGHRIQQQSWKDSAVNAKDHGADLVRVWSAVLDGRTRPTHRLYDGTITEVTEPFHLPNGKVVDRPSDFGDPSEDCNCRCIARSVPRWALEAGVMKMDNFTGQMRTFNSYDDYEKFKEDYWSDENIKYMQYVQKMEEKYGTTDFKTLLGKMEEREFDRYITLENSDPFINVLEMDEDIEVGEIVIPDKPLSEPFASMPEDKQEMSRQVDSILNSYTNVRKSKWSGKTVTVSAEQMGGALGRKEWSCDIALREDAGIKTAIHEHLHARSVSYFSSVDYYKWMNIEEASVELFAQEIAKDAGLLFKRSYPDEVSHLLRIKSILGIKDDFEFAKKIFEIPMDMRYNYLKEEANALIGKGILKNKTVEALNDAVEYFAGV